MLRFPAGRILAASVVLAMTPIVGVGLLVFDWLTDISGIDWTPLIERYGPRED